MEEINDTVDHFRTIINTKVLWEFVVGKSKV